MSHRCLHVCTLDKFIPPFHQFIRKNFPISENKFFLIGDLSKYCIALDEGTMYFQSKIKAFSRLLFELYKADKIILHGLFNFKIIFLLFLNPWLLKKCYWVIWGGDLYSFMYPQANLRYKIKEWIRAFVIQRFGFLLTYLEGDVALARKHYRAKGKHLETIAYLSNVVSPHQGLNTSTDKSTINILIGNSADPTNEHHEMIDLLAKYNTENIKVYAPLSYGNQDYAQKIIEYGKAKLAHRFYPLTDFMQYHDYKALLESIDIAIFNHKRQQAMGNTINLLAMAKVVYLRNDTVQQQFFKNMNVKTFDRQQFDLSLKHDLNNNTTILCEYFSLNNLTKQWQVILKD